MIGGGLFLETKPEYLDQDTGIIITYVSLKYQDDKDFSNFYSLCVQQTCKFFLTTKNNIKVTI